MGSALVVVAVVCVVAFATFLERGWPGAWLLPVAGGIAVVGVVAYDRLRRLRGR